MKIDIRCPLCKSRRIRTRLGDKMCVCVKCGHVFNLRGNMEEVEEEEEDA